MLNVAVVGLGWWGRVVTQLLQQSPRFEVIMGVDTAAEAAGFARERKIALSGDLGNALADSNVHAVILCTPHSQHTDQIIRAANAKKHVFCEKPLSLSRADVLRAVEACNANQVVLAVGHEKRFEPPIQEVMRLSQSGVLVSFRSGANALLSAMLATPFVGRFAVFGNQGWAEVRDQAHPESPEGWTLTTCFRGGRPQVRDYPPARSVLANLEAFADAVEGRAPYPVPQEQMIANISALEAIFRSATSGRVEMVEN